jgi:hypothetical protein
MDFLNSWRAWNGNVIEETGLTAWLSRRAMLHMGMSKNQKHVWIFPLLQHSNTPTLQFTVET